MLCFVVELSVVFCCGVECCVLLWSSVLCFVVELSVVFCCGVECCGVECCVLL